jgi:hypothetical protein
VPQKRKLKVQHKVTRLTVNLLTSSVVRGVVPAYYRALYNAKTDTSNVRPYLLTPSIPVLCILKRKYAVLQRRKNLPGALSFFPAKREILPNCVHWSTPKRHQVRVHTSNNILGSATNHTNSLLQCEVLRCSIYFKHEPYIHSPRCYLFTCARNLAAFPRYRRRSTRC